MSKTLPQHRMIVLPRTSTRTIVWLLTLALLLAQLLGLMHSTLHGQGAGASAQVVSRAALQVLQTRTSVDAQLAPKNIAKTFVSSLFSSHGNSIDCRLYDQASHGSAAPHVLCLALPVVLPPSAVAIFQGEALARWVALFDARGPPFIS